jgi:chromosome segregation ATPase
MNSPAVLLFLLGVGHAAKIRHKVTPVEKVISLLEKLKEETAAEAQEDAKTYDEFACFCKEQADNKFYAITKSKELIKQQTAKIKLLGSEITELNKEVVALQDEKEKLEGEQKDADETRAQEFQTYSAEEAKMADAISRIERAIQALEDSKAGMEDAKLNLAQVEEKVSKKQFKEIMAFLELAKSTAPGKPPAYEYRSNDIISTLKGLLKTFKQNKVDLDTEEAGIRNQYELAKQARENTIEFTAKDIEEKKGLIQSKEKEKAETEQLKKEETADMNADQAFLDELTTTCEQKAKDFDQRSKARVGEITAVTKALEILKSGVQPNYSANKKLTMFMQSGKKAVQPDEFERLLQANEESDDDEPVREDAIGFVEAPDVPESFIQLRGKSGLSMLPRVVTFLTRRANRLHSPVLQMLTIKIQAGSGKDHFVKVRGLIKDLIAKLEADAESEAEQKGFCDKEMAKATTARDKAIGQVETLTATIDELESAIAKLTELIDELGTAIADLRKALFEETELRSSEKADNTKTIGDSEAGLEAVKGAIQVLKDFYESAFTQFVPAGADRDGNTVKDLAPAGQEGTYHGNQDAAKGIFGMLEVIQSDFERTVDKTTEEEDKAQEEFDAFEKETKQNLEDKAAEKKQAEKDKETKEADLTAAQASLKDEQELLSVAKEELEKLKPLCVDTGMDWKERRARQEQEVEALKEALAILSEI